MDKDFSYECAGNRRYQYAESCWNHSRQPPSAHQIALTYFTGDSQTLLAQSREALPNRRGRVMLCRTPQARKKMVHVRRKFGLQIS